MEKFVQDSTLLTQIHDMDMVFELLTNIAKQTTDEALTAIQQTDRKEVYRPWNAMLKDTSEEDCEARMIK
jgi:predicted GTPase